MSVMIRVSGRTCSYVIHFKKAAKLPMRPFKSKLHMYMTRKCDNSTPQSNVANFKSLPTLRVRKEWVDIQAYLSFVCEELCC